MKILITGGKGFFGSWLVPALLEEHDVIGYDIQEGNDIFDENKLLDRMMGQDAVIHLAAIPHYKEDIPDEHYKTLNVEGTRIVAHNAVKAGIGKFIFTSFGAVYGFAQKQEGYVKPPLREDQVYCGYTRIDPYAQSKLEAEELLSKTKKMTITVLRINGILEPKDPRYNWGWVCSQETAIKAYRLALNRDNKKFLIINIADNYDNLDRTNFDKLLRGE